MVTSVSFLSVMRLRNEHVERTFSGRRVRVAPAARIRDRAAARLRAGRLDLELARGAPPESTAALALRARRLTSLGCRRSIAETYLRLIRDARESARPRPRKARLDQSPPDAPPAEFPPDGYRVELPSRPRRIVPSDPLPERVIAAAAIVGESEDPPLAPGMALPRLGALRRDPYRRALRAPGFPHETERKRRFEEIGEAPGEGFRRVAVDAQRPAHHRLVDERSTEERSEVRRPASGP